MERQPKQLNEEKELQEIQAKILLNMTAINFLLSKDITIENVNIVIENQNYSVIGDLKKGNVSTKIPLTPEFKSLEELYIVTKERLIDAIRLKSGNQNKIKLRRDDFWLNVLEDGYAIYKINGQGTCYYKNGDRYEGRIDNGWRSGKGTLYYSNCDKYEGMWKYDQRNGRGTIYFANGKLYEGEWIEDEICGKGIFIDPHENSVNYINQKTELKITSSGISFYSLDSNNNKILEEISPEAVRPMLNFFFSNLGSFSYSNSLKAINTIEKNPIFLSYLKPISNLNPEDLIKKTDDTKKELNKTSYNKAFEEIYLKYLEAMHLYQSPDKYCNEWNINYLKYIKELGNLGLDLEKEELKNNLLLKQHDFSSFDQEAELEKLIIIPGYNEALEYIQNPNHKTIYQNHQSFIKILKEPEISANDIQIFFIDKNSSAENITKIISENKPALHGIAYYFFSKEGDKIFKLGYGGKLTQDDYLNRSSDVVKIGLNQQRMASIFLLEHEDLKNISNDKDLFNLIYQNKNHAILFKNNTGQNIPLDISGLNKLFELPNNSVSPKSTNKIIENFVGPSKNI